MLLSALFIMASLLLTCGDGPSAIIMLLPILDCSFSQLCISCCVRHMAEEHGGSNHVSEFC